MQLVSFTVTKYRSIKRAHKIQVERQTVLVGPNNEGKSNLLRALVTAMQILRGARQAQFVTRGGTGRLATTSSAYRWERDYPQALQATDPQGRFEITLEFELSPEEIADFRREVRSTLNGTLPIRISLGPERDVAITVIKKGPGGKALTAKSSTIAQFVSRRVNIEHIPAVRTASAAEQIVDQMVERELETLEGDPAYREALDSIAELQRPVLGRLSESIKETLVKFLPSVRDVSV